MDDDERIYRLTIRGLYVAALVLNAWVLWDQVRDSPEGQALVARVQKVSDKLTHPVRDAQLFRRQANAVLYEAETIVEGFEHDD